MRQIKLSVTMKHGPKAEDEYRSGAVLSEKHFPEEKFGEHPERTMTNLVAGGSAIWVESEEPVEPAKSEKSNENKKDDGKNPGGKK